MYAQSRVVSATTLPYIVCTWWLIPLSGLVHPSYKWITYNWGYNPLTIRGMSHQVYVIILFHLVDHIQLDQGSLCNR